jgi:hypothetical protein
MTDQELTEKVTEALDEEQAEEYFEFNLAGAWVGESTPIYLEELE